MPLQDIDRHGNRHNRRAVAAIQRRHGADGRKAAAQAKRARKNARRFEQDLNRTITFFAWPARGFVAAEDPDGAYLGREIGGRRQVIVAGEMKVAVEHYVRAIGVFLKTGVSLESEAELTHTSGRPFRSLIINIIVEVA